MAEGGLDSEAEDGCVSAQTHGTNAQKVQSFQQLQLLGRSPRHIEKCPFGKARRQIKAAADADPQEKGRTGMAARSDTVLMMKSKGSSAGLSMPTRLMFSEPAPLGKAVIFRPGPSAGLIQNYVRHPGSGVVSAILASYWIDRIGSQRNLCCGDPYALGDGIVQAEVQNPVAAHLNMKYGKSRILAEREASGLGEPRIIQHELQVRTGHRIYYEARRLLDTLYDP